MLETGRPDTRREMGTAARIGEKMGNGGNMSVERRKWLGRERKHSLYARLAPWVGLTKALKGGYTCKRPPPLQPGGSEMETGA